MQAMFIVTIIFAILAKGGLGALAVINLTQKKGSLYIIIIASLGVLVLGDIFAMIGIAAAVNACGIIGCIFWLLGWPGLAVGNILLHLKSMAPASSANRKPGPPVMLSEAKTPPGGDK